MKRILAIDDEKAVRKSFELALEDTGYRVEAVESGAEAVERARKGRYDLVFLDLKMPGMDGVATLRALREIDGQVPIYIVTAFHEEFLGQLQCAADDGLAFEVVRKPVGADEIALIARGVFEGPVAS
ncbi:MAG: response regulator [Planctomycetota bacterium]